MFKCNGCGKTFEDKNGYANFCPYCGNRNVEPMNTVIKPAGRTLDDAYYKRKMKTACFFATICSTLALMNLFCPMIDGRHGLDLMVRYLFFSSSFVHGGFIAILAFLTWAHLAVTAIAVAMCFRTYYKGLDKRPTTTWFTFVVLSVTSTFIMGGTCIYFSADYGGDYECSWLIWLWFVIELVFMSIFSTKRRNLIRYFDRATDPNAEPMSTPVQRTAATPAPAHKATADSNALVNESERIEMLKQYKELLDLGAITQEEYDKKKAEILSSGK